jgi:hypothetical protein
VHKLFLVSVLWLSSGVCAFLATNSLLTAREFSTIDQYVAICFYILTVLFVVMYVVAGVMAVLTMRRLSH